MERTIDVVIFILFFIANLLKSLLKIVCNMSQWYDVSVSNDCWFLCEIDEIFVFI
jgi:hypothetical protein